MSTTPNLDRIEEINRRNLKTLVEAAEAVCHKLESERGGVTWIEQLKLRSALNLFTNR